MLWERNKRTPYVPSPLLYKGTLYTLGHYQAILSCIDPNTGQDIAGAVPIAGIAEFLCLPGSRCRAPLSCGSQAGATMVLKHGADPEPVALNQLDDSFSATPALAGKELFLRGESFLYCIRSSNVPQKLP